MNLSKNSQKLLQRQLIQPQINSQFTPATNLKFGRYVLIPNFVTKKGISYDLLAIRKGPFQVTDQPTDVTYKLIDSIEKEKVQHRNILLPIYQKQHALRELTQLYTFTGLKLLTTIRTIIITKNKI